MNISSNTIRLSSSKAHREQPWGVLRAALDYSTSVMSLLKSKQQEEYETWHKRKRSWNHWIYVFEDDIHSWTRSIHGEKLCTAVVIGVDENAILPR